MIIPLANTSSIFVCLLSGLFGGGRRGLDGSCCWWGAVSVDAVVSTLAGALCKEVAGTVVMVLAGVTFVALAFELPVEGVSA